MSDRPSEPSAPPHQPGGGAGWYVLFVVSVVVIGYFALRSSLQKDAETTTVHDHGTDSYDAWGRSPEVVAKTLGHEDDPQVDMGVGPSTTPAVNEPDSLPAEPPVAAPLAVTPERTYVVQPGDVLGEISRKMYGTTRHSSLIMSANPALKDPDFLKVGMVLKIPAPPAAPNPSISPAATESADFILYTVVDKDNAWVIAEKMYGKGHLNSEIMKDNPDKFKNGKNLLKVGDQIKLRRSLLKQQ